MDLCAKMWGESSKNCEMNCQCSGLITESFKINSGNSATKRKQEEALSNNYRVRTHPHTLDFNRQSPVSSPICTPSKRRVLGEIQNSPLFRPKDSPTIERLKNTPINKQKSPLIDTLSPLTSRSDHKRNKISKISRIFEERSRYKMANKENNSNLSETFINFENKENQSMTMFNRLASKDNQSLPRSDLYYKRDESLKLSGMFNKFASTNNVSKSLNMSETFVKLDVEEETRDCMFGAPFPSSSRKSNWCAAKLDFTDTIQSKPFEMENETKNIDMYVPEKEESIDPDFETLHDLEEEFDCNNFDECSKYEIISTDSPNIISSGRSTSRKVHSRNFDFGAPLLDSENSTCFNKPNANATRMLNFEDEAFEFTSPAVKTNSASVKKSLKSSVKHNVSVKKSLKFSETPTKTLFRHERSDSSIGSMSMSSMSPVSTKLRIFPSDSTMSMESGFISELEDPFLDYEISNSPKMANFNELLSGQIKNSFADSKLVLSRNTDRIDDIEKQFEFPKTMNSDEVDHSRVIDAEEMTDVPSLPDNEISGLINDSITEKQLLSGNINDSFVEKPFNLRRPLQRSLSFNPQVSKARVSLFSIKESPNQEKKNNKRVERSETESMSSKRRRSNCQSPEVEKPVRPVLQRAFSENHASIMSAMSRFEAEPSLIGDFTLPFALPLTSGDHTDLKSISCDTLAGLLRGDYSESISEFQVIDCRYPYEFEGGHIAGAVNLYTPELVQALVETPRTLAAGRRILVFHCEFSRERGPKLSRYLRSTDREKNRENYPSLHYPEVYLLHSGYRAFYQRYPELCSPAGYTAMLDPTHRVAMKKHRSFSQPSASVSHRRNRFLL
ncbi:uncharacterized protein LOC112047786 [Bicyclus anynana]|uniref:protein-tyrosine-phosphatase n=1 Tax=Bicyclus anynana TaxID=110368 RepID=A0A6J1N1P9_BICAN|nr:uncharacterized protein LOC112047786 [Bicyclus anynana]